MANHKSARKRHRQNLKRREQNRVARGSIRTTVKSALEASTQGDSETALAKAKIATTLLDKAVVHGVLHKNNAARRISRLHRLINSAG